MSTKSDKLFKYNTPWKTSGSKFDALDTNPKEWAMYARGWLENAYSEFPDNSKKDLRERFQDKRLGQHQGAYFELIIHELMRRSGGKIKIHHSGLGGRKTPDFLVESDGQSFLLETKTLMPRPDEDKYYYEDTEKDVFRKLGCLVSKEFFFRVKFSGVLSRNLPKSKIKQEVRPLLRWGTGNLRDLKRIFSTSNRPFSQIFSAEDSFHYLNIKEPPHGGNMAFIEDGEWKMSVSLIPTTERLKDLPLESPFYPEPERMIDTPRDGLGRGGLDEKIRDRLREFTNGYQGLRLPLVLAIHLTRDSPIRPHNWIRSLLLGPDSSNEYPQSSLDGWFMQEGGKRKIPFVAVWFFLGLSPALMLNTRHEIFINPAQTGEEFPDLLNKFTSSRLDCNEVPRDLERMMGWDFSMRMWE